MVGAAIVKHDVAVLLHPDGELDLSNITHVKGSRARCVITANMRMLTSRRPIFQLVRSKASSHGGRSFKSLITASANHPHWAHPAFWAPFVVVGEGARR